MRLICSVTIASIMFFLNAVSIFAEAEQSKPKRPINPSGSHINPNNITIIPVIIRMGILGDCESNDSLKYSVSVFI